MLSVLGGSYLIVGEMGVQWLPSALKIPVEDPPKAVYMVWLLDSLGVRAAIFVCCPSCRRPLGLSPGDAEEQRNWNKKPPKLNSIMACGDCTNTWMITEDTAYHLLTLPVPPKERTPRILAMPTKGDMA